jgi:hypothetical protein
VAACDTAASFLQALVALSPKFPDPGAEQLYEEQNPITLIAKCDKSMCAGKGIKSYQFGVQLTAVPGSTAADYDVSTACTAKGVIDPGLPYCTDYRQSTRDNAGDVYLYVLFAKDLKGIFR